MMKQTDQIEISLNKKTLLPILFIYIVVITIGLFFIINYSVLGSTTPTRHGNPLWLLIVGIVAVLVIGYALLPLLRRLLSKKAGLIISREGIIDNMIDEVVSVSWSDIIDIKSKQIKKDSYIVIIVKNHQEYIDRVISSDRRYGMKFNYKTHGSPIVIFAKDLQMNFDDLHNLLLEKLREYHEKQVAM